MLSVLKVIYGQLVKTFQRFSNGDIQGPELSSQVARFSLYFVYLAIAMFTFIYAATVIFFLCGEAITRRLRLAYLRAVLCQNMAFFDLLGSGTVTTNLTSDINLVHDALSAKISLTLTAAATCLTALIITFVMSWRLALVLTASTVVAMVLANSLGTRFAVRYNRRALDAAARSNAMAEEALRSYKHAAAFGIQSELETRYASHLQRARHHSLRARCVVALTMTAFMSIMYLSSGLSFWQGSRFLVAADISASSVVTCSMAVLISALTVSKVAPNAQAFVSGINGSDRLRDGVKRRSPMDPMDASGKKPSSMLGRLELKQVRLVYPSRPDKFALRDVDMVFPAGKMTAVIGASGCGKSSIVGLVERFYMPTSGSISLDDVDIQELNLHWLRQKIALVSQEPVLFKGSVFDNIRHGLIGKLSDNSDATNNITSEIEQQVEEAAKTANAHEFISQLPQGYATDVGEMGGHLSGGQRQRIAIARAIIGNPRILLLDEATAALDSESEHVVLDALQRASVGRTTIFITHRLSSIRDADQIIVMSDGQVLETGSHETLLGFEDGFYARMLDKQRLLTLQAAPDLTGNYSDEHLHTSTMSYSSQKMSQDEKGLQSEKDILHSRIQPKDESTRPAAQAPCATELPREHKTATPKNKGSTWSLVKMAISLNKPELPLVFIGLVCCLMSGALIPVQSLFFAHSIVALSLPPPEYPKLRSDTNFWCLMYLMLGLVAFVSWGGQGFCLAFCSEKLVYRARTRAFRSILRQDISFFDRPLSSVAGPGQDRQHKNTTGSLMTVLSSSATHLAGLGGAVLSTVLTAFATLAGGVILSLIIGWKLALVCTATVPIVLVCGWLRLRVLSNMEAQTKAAYADSAAFAGEAIASIRTVAALCMEEYILESYQRIVDRTAAQNRRSILISSSLYAASQSIVFLVAALGFWYGGSLIANHGYTMLQYFVCFAALVSGSQSVGAVFSFAPDISRAIHGAEDFRRLFDATPKIDVWRDEGLQMEKAQCQGALELHNVTFRYDGHETSEHASAMPLSTAVSNFSLKIASKQTVALVGHSGCGKSTIISLLERFIDPNAGAITLDGVDIRDMNLSKYRSLISLVGQETFLYQGSIRDNLLLGVGRTDVSQEEIDDACAQVNILDFLRSLPDGYETEVGSRGVMLSGGQKQRIAIARALLRNSPILLLDEATSALDGDSEQVVQSALDAARQSRTTVLVAHRLKTVQNADVICVIERGAIAEMGTHAELMKANSKYASMVRLQSLEE